MAVLGSGKVEIDTYGELKTLIAAVTTKQKGLKIKGVVIDAIVDELVGKLPGGPTAKKTLDFVKAAFGKPDTVKTNTWLDRLDVDDQFSAIVDDTIENNFLQSISKRIESQKDNTPLRQDFNMNTELIDYLGKKHKGRTVAGPQNENKKMKKSQLRQLVKEAMAGGYAMNRKSGKLEPHYDKLDSTKLSSLLMGMLEDEPQGGDPEEGEKILIQKSDPENVARILRGEKPIYKESALSPEYLTNIYSDSPIKEIIEATVYQDGSVDITLRSGEKAVKRAAAIPLKELTEDYLRGLITDAGFRYSENFEKGVADFITKVFSNPKVKSVQSV